MGPLHLLDLSDEQRGKITKIQDDHRKKDWDVMGKIMDEQAKLRDLLNTDKPDPKKAGAVYGAIAKLRQQMVETQIDIQNRIYDVLSPEQRDQLRQWRRNPPGPGRGMGPGMGMHPGMGPRGGITP
jgi:Spy/CpxP family protein refolding chaperone